MNIGIYIHMYDYPQKRTTGRANNFPAGEVGAGVRKDAVLRRDGVLGRGQGGGGQDSQGGGGAGGLSRGIHRCVHVILFINTSYQKLPFGSGDYPDKLLFHQALN